MSEVRTDYLIMKHSFIQYLPLLLTLLSNEVCSHETNTTFNRITVKGGLTQSTGTFILQDEAGFIWLATHIDFVAALRVKNISCIHSFGFN